MCNIEKVDLFKLIYLCKITIGVKQSVTFNISTQTSKGVFHKRTGFTILVLMQILYSFTFTIPLFIYII